MIRSARGSSRTLGSSRSWCAARRIATRCAVLLNLPSCMLGLATQNRLKFSLNGDAEKITLDPKKTTTGAEAPTALGLYAALKRRSSTVLHTWGVLHASVRRARYCAQA